MPTMDFSVGVTICFVPAMVARTGEPYAGPGPAHFHFSAPLLRSYATTWPSPSPPRSAMTFPSVMMGEDEVKNRGQALVFFRHTSLPVAASRHESMPRTPNVTILPSATTGVLRGPGWEAAARVAASAAYLS